jgi:hypothetical protein
MSMPGMSPAMNPMSPLPSSNIDLHVTSMTPSSLQYQQPHSPGDGSPYSRTSPNKTLLPSGINILRAALTGSPDVSSPIWALACSSVVNEDLELAARPGNDNGI